MLSFPARILAGVAAAAFAGSVGMAAATTSKPDSTTFRMFPQTAFVKCMKPSPSAPTPEVTVTVNRGALNDHATVRLHGFKPNLDFDLFTIQHSPQTATGAA